MKIENQVCSLEQAKKLKDLGINDSLFYYREYKSSRPEYSGWKILPKVMHDVEWEYGLSVKGRIEPHIETVRNTYACGEFPYGSAGELFPAYTVAELGEMLPEWIYKKGDEYRRIHWRNVEDQYEQDDDEVGEVLRSLRRIGFCMGYQVGTNFHQRIVQLDETSQVLFYATEAECRAAMLIHLIESNLITVEEINNRLTCAPKK